ncbi:uncharacterized protein LOC143422655 [Xylocopa sonorina]|uniref:uncharacterized protein LOC143422655 n=1 Tax=Xylocopa sonorina TaxID=1818115 RepID=UPI00403AD1D2
MDNIGFRRKPETNDFRTELRATPERERANNWRQEDNSDEIFLNAVRNNRNATRRSVPNETNAFQGATKNRHAFRSHPKNTEPRYAPSYDPRFNCRINSHQAYSDKNQMYFEDRSSREMPRCSLRNYEESCNNTEVARRRLAALAKSSDWGETTASRIRSRTCSPPVNRRQRTQCAPKPTKFVQHSSYASSEFNSEESKDNVQTMLTGNSFSQDVGSKLYVDRAVDKDSLSDMQQTRGSNGSLFSSIDKTANGVEKYSVRTSFWEFIPFDDEETRKQSAQNKSAPVRSCNDRNAAGTFNNRKNTFINLSNEQQPESRIPTPKGQSKIAERLTSEWNEKTNRYLKRPGSAKLEFNEDKKKKMANIVERTAACLQRKPDKSLGKTESPTLNQSSPARTEKKVCSKLPIRIGNRLRSRNPTTKLNADAQEENKRAETRDLPRSNRSRTKPRIKPSVVLNEVIHNTETFADSQSIIGQWRNDINANKNSPTFEHLGDGKLEDEKVDESKIPGMAEAHRKRPSVNPNGGRETKVSGIGFKGKRCFRLNEREDTVCNNYCNREHRNLSSFQSKKPATIRSQF